MFFNIFLIVYQKPIILVFALVKYIVIFQSIAHLSQHIKVIEYVVL